MVCYYTYEYGMVGKSDARHVYCSKDRLIGLIVRSVKTDGRWAEGYSRFFVWEDGPGGAEYEYEKDARHAAEHRFDDTRRMVPPPLGGFPNEIQ